MDISNLSIATIRSLGIDTINKANSGHPGMVLGSAPALYTLFNKELNIYKFDRALNSNDYSATFVCCGELDRLNKQRVKFYMPKLMSEKSSRSNPVVVTVTCATLPPLDRSKGTEYLGAYATTSLHKING